MTCACEFHALTLVGWILGRMKKKCEKYERKWVGRVFGWEGEGERKVMGSNCFLSGSTTIQSLQNGEKMGEKMRKIELDKIALLHLVANFLSFSTFVFLLFIYLFICFCLDKISSSLHSTSTLVWFVFSFFKIKFCTVDSVSFCLFLSFFLISS